MAIPVGGQIGVTLSSIRDSDSPSLPARKYAVTITRKRKMYPRMPRSLHCPFYREAPAFVDDITQDVPERTRYATSFSES